MYHKSIEQHIHFPFTFHSASSDKPPRQFQPQVIHGLFLRLFGAAFCQVKVYCRTDQQILFAIGKAITYSNSNEIAHPASARCSSRAWDFPTSILQSKVRVCATERSNESPSGAFKRQNGLRQQMEGLRPDKFADVYTSALLATTMKSLNALPKFENHFVVKTVRFQVQLEADGYFFFRKFLSLQPQQSGRVGTNSQFLNQIFQIRLQKYLLGFSQTRHSAQNCAE